jgi:hypothetical protein
MSHRRTNRIETSIFLQAPTGPSAVVNGRLALLAFLVVIGLKAGVALGGANVWTTGGPAGEIVLALFSIA